MRVALCARDFQILVDICGPPGRVRAGDQLRVIGWMGPTSVRAWIVLNDTDGRIRSSQEHRRRVAAAGCIVVIAVMHAMSG
jgi:hypothetical protein